MIRPNVFRRPFRLRALLAAVLFSPPFLGTAFAATPPAFTGPHEAGQLGAPPRNEASGLAASRRSPDVLWTHDDSGGADALYAVGTTGELRRILRLSDAKNTDWEDIATVDLDGKSWLVIGNIGDNDAKRKRVMLHFVEEPTTEQVRQNGAASGRPTATLRITFSDGPRDCESLAIDPRERAIYLLSKRDLVPRLYRVALPPAPLTAADLVAEFVSLVPSLARPTGANALFAALLEKGRARPCGMDFAPDGSAAAVVTYADVVVFPRQPGETWSAAFARDPIRLPAHGLPQAESVCFSYDGSSIYVASEDTRRLLRYDRK